HVFGGNKGVLLSLFSTFDTDRNGIVDIPEVVSALILCSKLKMQMKWKLLFDLNDENLDNELSEAEIDMMMLSCHRGMAKMMSKSNNVSIQSLHGIAAFVFRAVDRGEWLGGGRGGNGVV
ncbi:hypothetical protein TrRE_jg6530, partial [Triparma retinervis]